MSSKAKILVIDDDPEVLAVMRFQLGKQGYEVTGVGSGEAALEQAAQQQFDLALTDLYLPEPGIDGLEVVRQLRETTPDTPIIMISGGGKPSDTIDAIKAGAYYFVPKPVKFEELYPLMDNALELQAQRDENRRLLSTVNDTDRYLNIIGGSHAMRNLYEVIDRVAKSDANIMIIGESGTGKELIANAIHFKSLRSKKPFVKINCSALPKELIESELFGHTKGAFTGATGEKQGLIAQARGGSLLLDEIGEMPLELQPKLLRVLQERVYYRIGSEKALEADFRLISATNRHPDQAIAEGNLREDLYYRINTIEIHVPPLRERAEDVQHLAEHFLREFAIKYDRPVRSISQRAYARMFEYQWPGNVRELQNVMERAVLLCEGETIEETAMPLARQTQVAFREAASSTIAAPKPIMSAPAASPSAPPQQVFPGEMTFEHLGRILVSKAAELKTTDPDVDLFTKIEGAIVKASLECCRGNKQAAANLLGVYRPRLYHLLRKHNLHNLIRSASNPGETETQNGTTWPESWNDWMRAPQ
jgi:DNA-binding NtrC family response regulator